MALKGKTTKKAAMPVDIKSKFIPSTQLPILRGLKLGIYGEPKNGKTHLTLTAPGDLYVIDIEGNTKLISEKFDDELKERLFIQDVVSQVNENEDAVDCANTLDAIEDAIEDLLAHAKQHPEEKGTIIIDSGSELWSYLGDWLSMQTDLARARSSGKMIQTEWGRSNKRHADMLRNLKIMGWNVIIVAQAYPSYGSDGTMLGFNDAKWQKAIPYWVDVFGELKKTRDGSQFIIRGCRFDYSLIGDIITDPTYEKIVKHIETKTKLSLL